MAIVEVILREQTRLVVVQPPSPILEIIAGGAQGQPGVRGERGVAGAPGGVFASYPTVNSMSGHIAVMLNAQGAAIPAESSIARSANTVVGITIGASGAGEPAQIQSTGLLEHSGWSFTPDLPVFLGLNGALTQAVPAQALFSKVLGVALSATSINIGFQPAIFL